MNESEHSWSLKDEGIRWLLLLALVAMSSLPASAKQLTCQSTITPVDGYNLGVRDGRILHLYAAEQGQWWRQKSAWDLSLPPGVRDVYAYDGLMGVKHGSTLEFYAHDPAAEGTRWRDDGAIPFPELGKDDVAVSVMYSTEHELLVIGPTGATLFSGQGKIALGGYAGAAPDRIDCAFGMSSFQLAIVSGDKVLVYVLVPGKTDQELQWSPRPDMTYIVPAGTDEVMMFRFEYLGIRRGNHVRFLHYQRKAWVSDDDVPDFDLSSRDALPVNEAD